jgi:DEAD/DEAH box helicase domain-containing protein
MLPLQQAYEVKYSIIEYLKATFSFKDKAVNEAFYDFINNPEEGIFKGPYISLKLPFVKALDDQNIPLEIKPTFPPYQHQSISFERLTTENDHQPQPTLITTGTSSGKTECFLFPVLDYCFKNLDKRGIKVIILYPMNALATDQAKRLAEIIWNDDRLKGKMSAGLFIGEGKDKKKFPKEMGEHNIIENRDSIVDSPPDILLTNFKMLDYGLMRHNFHNLWTFNLEDPTLLKFLILDELHTYDGAQGTDVANLIRRLKLKLNIPKGQICPIGTSATMGTGEESKQLLAEYAEKVFGEHFDETAIITEHRVSIDKFFVIPEEELEAYIPRQVALTGNRLTANETYETYITKQRRLWLIPELSDQIALGEELKKLRIVKNLISITCQGIFSLSDIIIKLADLNNEFRRLPEWDPVNELNPREELINSLIALITEAKTGNKFPLLYLQIQLWIRELSGVLRETREVPVFTWKDKVGGKYDCKALPAYYCRECGASGWLGIKHDNKTKFEPDPKEVYDHFFKHHKNIYFINTTNHPYIEEFEPTTVENRFIHEVDLTLHDNPGDLRFQIQAVRKLRETKSRHICPECNTENSINIIGTRVATLSSITVSQVLSSDLDERTEKYRKILAFSNSVQDAAHQAGFIEARNYRFTFRSSLQKVLNIIGNPVTIPELQSAFKNYWKQYADETGEYNDEAYFFRFFPSDYAGKIDLSSDYKDHTKKFTAAFRTEFDHRMDWEVISEFGYNAIIGRTLEKSGASAVKFDENKIKNVFPILKEWLSQNNLLVISENDLLPFINGILHRIRVRGGVDHEYLRKFREGSFQLWDLNWMKDNRHFLNRMFHPSSRFPRVITTIQHSRGVLDSTFTNGINWFSKYYIKSFPLASHYQPIINEFYQKVFEALNNVGILHAEGDEEHRNYCIDPNSIIVENKVAIYGCSHCGSLLSVAPSDIFTNNTKCLDYSCSGTYVLTDKLKLNYYQLVYNRNRAPRIYAAEHTGLLERKDRETKEIDFKDRPKFNSLNTIVATSTLEMGIDIGTLNSAINNSVPPLPSNFLQRVGRAGRSSGTALITNFAQSKSHDLFYFEEPREMMEGEINTPGCYLEAKDIFFRHFFAFCIDSWTANDPKNNAIPQILGLLRLQTTDLSSPDFLINKILSFLKSNENKFFTSFSSMYEPDLKDKRVLIDLKEYLQNEGFFLERKRVFVKVKEEYLTIETKRKEIDELIKAKNLPNTDAERKELESEKKALWGLKRIIDKRSTLEFMTNSGLLPNYAFPETGVTLNAWVRSNKAKASDSIPRDKQYEIVRSSRVAIRELAPDNQFYSQGNKLDISGLNTYDWKDPDTLLIKRFCSNCDHIDDKVISTEVNCPKCGDPSWSSIRNQHSFVKLNGVKSVNLRERSTLDDSNDERDYNHYNISRHLKFDSKTSRGAWGMKDIPFGIEYVKSVVISEVNLGLSSSGDANKITINNLENIPCHGFVTCKHCGKSTSNPHQAHYDQYFRFHYGYCKFKDHLYEGKTDNVFEEVFLFRDIITEALKVLLPVQDFESTATVNMFKAGLELGLKKYYKGNPQHIAIINYSEFNPINSRFDRYLVLYDNIPGGTGYLEKLFNTKEFTELINIAYKSIKECGCQFKGKDGCYRCIFTYGNQYVQEELSRAKAEALFKKIVDKSNAWENLKTGLGSLSGTGQIEESELEDRFLRSIRNYSNKNSETGWRFDDFNEDGIISYKLTVINGLYQFNYIVRPQIDLGTSDNVKYRTRTDFFITLSSINYEGKPIEDHEVLNSVKAIAIYLDGYTYHATKENLRFFNDLRKRIAIEESGDKLSWTLTWNDIEQFDEGIGDSLKLDKARYSQTISTYNRIPYWNSYKSELFELKNSMERLLWVLGNPLEDQKKHQKVGLLLSLIQDQFGKPSLDSQQLKQIWKFDTPIDDNVQATDLSAGNFYIISNCNLACGFGDLRIAIKVNDLNIESRGRIKEIEGGLEKPDWQYFWQIYNLIQENCTLGFGESTQSEDPRPDQEEQDFSCLQYFDDDLHPIVMTLIENHISFNREGSFFIEKDGILYAEAAIGFANKKIFINPLSEDDRIAFISSGYKELKPNEFKIDMVL